MTEPRGTRHGWWLLLALCLAPPGWAASWDDATFLEGLRQRRLFDLAETYCRQQLQAAEVPEASASPEPPSPEVWSQTTARKVRARQSERD